MKESAQLGRYVVAKRDIPANTLVMRELPLLRAPKQDSLMVVTVSAAFSVSLGLSATEMQHPFEPASAKEMAVRISSLEYAEKSPG